MANDVQAQRPAPPGSLPAPSSEAVLRVQGVSRYFGALKAVDDVSFEVTAQQILAVIGPNGAGKTTLFNVLTGVYPPTSGAAFFMGKPIVGLPDYAVTRLGIARTFQNLRLFRNLTVIDNVIVATYCRTRAGVWDALFKTRRARAEERASEERAHELLALCGIEASWWNLARNLPYGDQRRLEIARALATEPTLLLLDEPTCGMNPAEKEGMMALIERLRESGRTVILVEHDMNVVMGMSDYIIVLDHGVKICEGQPGAVQCDPAVIEAYLGRGRDNGLAAD